MKRQNLLSKIQKTEHIHPYWRQDGIDISKIVIF
jgi:hypothetical protein